MFRNLQVVPKLVYGRGCLDQLDDILAEKRHPGREAMVFLVDDVFEERELAGRLPVRDSDVLMWINVDDEPKTTYVDELRDRVAAKIGTPAGVLGIGGGSAMDIGKAVALMLTNPGSAADYQGWDLIHQPAVYHVGIPTLSGTGAEVSRTAVLTGPEKKLGLNSDYTVYDQIVLDPDLIANAPAEQRFYTGMDCFIHCVESLEGTFLNAMSQAYGEKAMELCREVYLERAPGDPVADEMLMMASYFGGLSIAYSQVGVCHALSYGLSYVLGLRHGIGNCVAFDYLEEFYPDGVREFRSMRDRQGVDLPRGLVAGLSEPEIEKMIDVALVMEPLWENALGPDWNALMPRERVRELYDRM